MILLLIIDVDGLVTIPVVVNPEYHELAHEVHKKNLQSSLNSEMLDTIAQLINKDGEGRVEIDPRLGAVNIEEVQGDELEAILWFFYD